MLFPAATALALIWGVTAAVRRSWVSDDAFISFRYAEHLARGQGLVFNPGERVEGFSNFLWTVWVAAGMKFGADPEAWSCAWSVAAFAGMVLLLALLARRAAGGTGRAAAMAFPAGALLLAAQPDWNVYATSGLETALFSFLLLMGYFFATRAGERSAAVGGGAFALAAITRPEGPLFAVLALAFLAARGRPRGRSVAFFACAFLVLWLPYTAWRVSYFGDFFPNTYYAKSAALSWWSQGWVYVRVYLQKYWPLFLALPAWIVARLRARTAPGTNDALPAHLDGAPLALTFLLTHSLYVMKIGGDFMFARMLLPIAPFLLVLLDEALATLARGRAIVAAGITAALAAGVLLMPDPVRGTDMVSGIANEPNFYTPDRTTRSRTQAESMRPYIDGLPVRMVFMGGEARSVYYSGVETAIEGATGLTDSAIARQPLAARGRVGHEKTASIDYLLGRRRVNLLYSRSGMRALNLGARVPDVPIAFGSHVAQLVRWEPELVRQFVARGAQVGDFPAHLDEYFKLQPPPTDSEVVQDYRKLKVFYFEPTGDRAREQVFLDRLRGMGR